MTTLEEHELTLTPIREQVGVERTIYNRVKSADPKPSSDLPNVVHGVIPGIQILYDLISGTSDSIAIETIKLDGKQRVVDPPLVFSISFNEADDLYEIVGEEDYSDIFLADDTLDNFKDILLNVVLPGLWEEYAREPDKNLSPEALSLKRVLRERIK